MATPAPRKKSMPPENLMTKWLPVDQSSPRHVTGCVRPFCWCLSLASKMEWRGGLLLVQAEGSVTSLNDKQACHFSLPSPSILSVHRWQTNNCPGNIPQPRPLHCDLFPHTRRRLDMKDESKRVKIFKVKNELEALIITIYVLLSVHIFSVILI